MCCSGWRQTALAVSASTLLLKGDDSSRSLKKTSEVWLLQMIGRQKINIIVAASLVVVALSAATAQQQEKSAPKSSVPTGKSSWRVRVSKEVPVTVTLRAVNAPLTDVASEIGRQLKVPFALSPVMKMQRVTLEVEHLPLETLLRTFAPQPYVDYMLDGGAASQPRYVALYLTAYNEPAPAANAVVKGTNEAVLVEGTFGEPEVEPAPKGEDEESRLRVSYEGKKLSVRAKDEPLSVVLYKISEAVGIPFELKYEGAEPIRLNISEASLEQAMRSLPPNVRLYYRLDIHSFNVTPLRLVLFAPNKT